MYRGDMTYQERYDKFVNKNVQNVDESGIINKNDEKGDTGQKMELKPLGKIGAVEQIEEEFGKLYTEDIIITDERIKHIRERHPGDYNIFEKFGRDAVNEPDIVIKDGKHEGTVFMVKKLPDTNLNVVVKVAIDANHSDYKNSVITFYRLRERNLVKMENKEINKILYKKA